MKLLRPLVEEISNVQRLSHCMRHSCVAWGDDDGRRGAESLWGRLRRQSRWWPLARRRYRLGLPRFSKLWRLARRLCAEHARVRIRLSDRRIWLWLPWLRLRALPFRVSDLWLPLSAIRICLSALWLWVPGVCHT